MQAAIEKQMSGLENITRLAKQAEKLQNTHAEASKAIKLYEDGKKVWENINTVHSQLEKMSEYETDAAADYKNRNIVHQAGKQLAILLNGIDERFPNIITEIERKFMNAAYEDETNRSDETIIGTPPDLKKQNMAGILGNFFTNNKIGETSTSLTSAGPTGPLFATSETASGNENILFHANENPGSLSSEDSSSSSSEDSNGDDEEENRRRRKKKKKKEKARRKRRQQKDEERRRKQMLEDFKRMLTISNTWRAEQETFLTSKPVEFPTFDGDVLLYASFKSLFNQLADDCGMSTTQRYAQLRAQLSPTVLETIAGIEMTPGNYDEIWELLDERYYSPRLIFEKIVSNLENAEPKEGKCPFSDLLNRIASFEINMKHLGMMLDPLQDKVITYYIIRQLSLESRRRLTDFVPDKRAPITMDNLKQFLQQEAMVWWQEEYVEYEYDEEER